MDRTTTKGRDGAEHEGVNWRGNRNWDPGDTRTGKTILLFWSFSLFVFVAKKPGLAVYGADARIPEINYVCKDHEEFKLGSLEITPLHTPCHTKGHVCYYVVDPATNEKAVFSGE